jgi:hypothetical protein
VVDRYLGRYGLVKIVAEPTAHELLTDEEERALLFALEVFLATAIISASELAAALVGGQPLTPDALGTRAMLAQTIDQVRGITEVTRAAIRRHLAEGAARGYSPRQIAYGVPDDDYPSLGGVVESVYARRAEAIAATETQRLSALSVAETYGNAGIHEVVIRDGPQCGWAFHDDPDHANGSIRTLAEFRAYPLSHPWCIRQGFPVRER